MHGNLDEFSLAEILQLFALAEKSGSVQVSYGENESMHFIESGVVTGWHSATVDVYQQLLECKLISERESTALRAVEASVDASGQSLIFGNTLEKMRWEGFVQRILEQHVYPLLACREGAFRTGNPKDQGPSVKFRIVVQQLVLDGSRWEIDQRELKREGYGVESTWIRAHRPPRSVPGALPKDHWLTWSSFTNTPRPIGNVAAALQLPDLVVARAVKELHTSQLLKRHQ